MENKITLDLSSATDISQYRGKIISFLKLQLAGAGKLSSCIINFFNENDRPEDFAFVKLVKPDFSSAQTLIPYHGSCLLLMEYDFCTLTDIDGNLLDGDMLTMILSEPTVS